MQTLHLVWQHTGRQNDTRVCFGNKTLPPTPKILHSHRRCPFPTPNARTAILLSHIAVSEAPLIIVPRP